MIRKTTFKIVLATKLAMKESNSCPRESKKDREILGRIRSKLRSGIMIEGSNLRSKSTCKLRTTLTLGLTRLRRLSIARLVISILETSRIS